MAKQTKKRKKKVNLFETFTKLWVSVLLVVAIIDLQLSYVLAYLGRDQIAETLSVAVVTEIIGVTGIYIIRAFFDTYSEKKMGSVNEPENPDEIKIDHDDNDNAVG